MRKNFVNGFFVKNGDIMGNWDMDFNEIVSNLKEILSSKWSWTNSKNCKYVIIKLDMRDGGCLLENSIGKKITLEELRHQEPLLKKDLQSEGL